MQQATRVAPIVVHIPHASTRIPEDIRPALLLGEDALEDELLQLKDIEYASYASQNPINVTSSAISQISGLHSQQLGAEIISVDPDFANALGVEMAWGKPFDTAHTARNKTKAIINESFLKKTHLESPEKMKLMLHNYQKDSFAFPRLQNL